MKPSIAAALLSLCLAPATAVAQASEAPAAALAPAVAPAAAPATVRLADADWSLGAGVGFGYGTSLGVAYLGAPLTSSLQAAPTVLASIERRSAPGRWWVLGVAGGMRRMRGTVPAGSYGFTRDDASLLALTAGVRQALTAEGAPVGVSVLATVSSGYAWQRQESQSAASETIRSEAWGLGGALGLAVERELTPGLALRVSTPILGVSWYRSTARSDVDGKATRDGAAANLALAPSLELRLAF